MWYYILYLRDLWVSWREDRRKADAFHQDNSTPPQPPIYRESPHPSYDAFHCFLKVVEFQPYPRVFHPLYQSLAGPIYGKTFIDHIRNMEAMYHQLMLDNPIDHEKLMGHRQVTYLRDVFSPAEGSQVAVQQFKSLYRLTRRIVEGYELRRCREDLGDYTFNNLVTVQQVLHDLPGLFLELFHEQKAAFPEIGTHPQGRT